MGSDGVLVEVDERHLRISFERPERRNAYDEEMAVQITDALWAHHDVEAVVITGSGGAFCAGGALRNLEESPDPKAMQALFTASFRMTDAIRSHPRPVIAAVDGAAAGGGNEVVIACDLAIATRRSTFGQTGPRVGSAPILGATNLAAVQLGEKRAKEMSFLCRRYTAEQALQMGLINTVVDDDDLAEAVDSMLEEIRVLSPRYLEIAKVSSNVWWNLSGDNFRSGLQTLVQAIGCEDMLEGAAAFVQKRKPDFRGLRSNR